MSAHAFDSHSVLCPICHRSKRTRLGDMGSGLYMCPYCQQRFVVSQSGHYVRDPVPTSKRRSDGQMLRRQSRPLARMRRDFRIIKPISLLAILGSAVFLGYTVATLDEKPAGRQAVQEILNWVKKTVESTGLSID